MAFHMRVIPRGWMELSLEKAKNYLDLRPGRQVCQAPSATATLPSFPHAACTQPESPHLAGGTERFF